MGRAQSSETGGNAAGIGDVRFSSRGEVVLKVGGGAFRITLN